MIEPEPDVELVSVLHTKVAGVLPLAEMALQEAKIEYLVRRGRFGVPIVTRQSETDLNSPVDPAEIVVRAEDAARARELLADLENSSGVAGTPLEPTTTGWQAEGPGPVHLTDADTGTDIGRITEDQFQQLTGRLEEDSSAPDQAYLNAETLDALARDDMEAPVAEMLNKALGTRSGMTIRWWRD